MKWSDRRRSSNIEDRRGSTVKKAAGGGITAIIITLAAMYFGIDPQMALQGASKLGIGGSTTQTVPHQASAKEQQYAEFTAVILADTEDAWNGIFKAAGQRYKEPKLVLFTGLVNSACGKAKAAMGPFYCSGDQKVYIDLSFYDDLAIRHKAAGDFAQAYVIAHEVGHHVQNLLGTSTKVHKAQRSLGKNEKNALSVRLELQADCYAGVWAHKTQKAKQVIEAGDIDEALNAATAIGDDRLQKEARGYVVPESFTHGSSAQRVKWFKKGIVSGDVGQCDTFKGEV